MKKILLILIITLCIPRIYAQPWLKSVTTENPTFYDYQEAFNKHWEPYDVKGGKYTKDGHTKKALGWKQFKRWEWYWEQRVGESGIFPKNTVNIDEWQKHKNTAKAIKTNTWKSLGPFNVVGPQENINEYKGVGRVNCLAFHPTNEEIMWAGTPAGGLWKTIDGGQNWTTSYDNMPVLGVSSIAIHPQQPDTMYIATGDGDGWHSIGGPAGSSLGSGDTKSIGILKSSDGGINWENVYSIEQSELAVTAKIIINPLNPNILYVASSLGVLMTSNSGKTWGITQVGEFIDIEFHPTNKDIIYASTVSIHYGTAQVFVSTDGGYNWLQTTSFSGVDRINIEVCPANEDLVELLCTDRNTQGLYGIYRSTDKGSTWNKYYSGGTGNNLLSRDPLGSELDGQAWYDLAFTIDPNNSNNIFVGGVNSWKTNNAGINWELSNYWTVNPYHNTIAFPEIIHADKHFLTFHPLNSSILYECNDGGIAKSIDGGTTWTEISNGLTISQAYSVSSSQLSSDYVALGLQDNGTFGYINSSWLKLNVGDGMICHFDYSNPNYFYSSYQNGKLWRFSLSDTIYTEISDSIAGGQLEGAWVTPYQLDPVNSEIIYACYDNVYKSLDRGDSWEKISEFANVTIKYLSVATTNTDYIYIAYYNNIYLTKNGGAAWNSIKGDLPLYQLRISNIQVNPNNENILIVTLSGYDETNKVFITEDAGVTWVNITGTGLPNLPVNCVEINKTNNDIYLGTDAGVYHSNNKGTTWERYGADLPNVVVGDIDIQYATSKLRAGTYGRGLWEIDLSTESIIESRFVDEDLNVYPNPNTGIITIHEKFINSEYEIISTKGEILKTGIADNNTIDISDFDNGVYFVKINIKKTGKYFSTKILKQ